MNVRIVNIRHAPPDPTGGRPLYVYATLINADNGVEYIHATLNYILRAVEERGYVLVGDKNVSTDC